RVLIVSDHPARINSRPFLGRTNPPKADFLYATAQCLTEILLYGHGLGNAREKHRAWYHAIAVMTPKSLGAASRCPHRHRNLHPTDAGAENRHLTKRRPIENDVPRHRVRSSHFLPFITSKRPYKHLLILDLRPFPT